MVGVMNGKVLSEKSANMFMLIALQHVIFRFLNTFYHPFFPSMLDLCDFSPKILLKKYLSGSDVF